MNKKIIISIIINALITVVVVVSRDYREFAPVLGPAFGMALFASIIGAVLIATGRKKQGAIMVCAGCALFAPVGIIGIRGALPILKEEGAGVWGTMKPWIIEAVVLIPLVVFIAIIGGTELKDIVRTEQTWLVRIKLVIGGSKYGSSVRDDFPDALIRAAEYNDPATFRLLVEKGADIKRISPIEVQALYNAEIFKLALEKGLEVNAKDEKGNTSLMWAVQGAPILSYYDEKAGWQKRDSAIVNLLAHKADVNARNNEGQTALMRVFIKMSGYHGDERTRVLFGPHNREIPQLLLDSGADVNARDNEGNTALMHALGNLTLIGAGESLSAEDIEELKLLVDRKADVSAANKEGYTPLKIAMQIPNPAEKERVVAMLKQAGAKR